MKYLSLSFVLFLVSQTAVAATLSYPSHPLLPGTKIVASNNPGEFDILADVQETPKIELPKTQEVAIESNQKRDIKLAPKVRSSLQRLQTAARTDLPKNKVIPLKTQQYMAENKIPKKKIRRNQFLTFKVSTHKPTSQSRKPFKSEVIHLAQK